MNLTDDEFIQHVMDYPGGCRDGKLEFLASLGLKPKIRGDVQQFRVTIEHNETGGFHPAAIARLIHNGMVIERDKGIDWQDSSRILSIIVENTDSSADMTGHEVPWPMTYQAYAGQGVRELRGVEIDDIYGNL